MKKKIKDLTIGKVKEICDKHQYYDKDWGWCCNHNCPLWNIENVCTREIPNLKEKDLDQEIEVEE